MKKQQIWQKTHKSLMPPNCSCIKNNWVFKINHNQVYWVHLVTCGYSHITGLDFSKNYYPVVNDIIFWILLLMVINFRYSAKIVDVKTAFLYSIIKEEIYVECLKGIENVGKDDCVILIKCIYCLVQAERKCYKKAIKILKISGFVGGSDDPCL